jgi:hypothetical protein
MIERTADRASGFSIGTPFAVVALIGVGELIAFAIVFFAFDWMTR